MLKYEQTVSLEHQLQVISIEASVISNLIDSIKNIFPDLSEKFKVTQQVTKDLTDTEQAFKDHRLDKDQQFVIKELEHFNYMDIAELTTMVPEGFNGSFIEYMHVMEKSLNRINSLNNEVMQPFYILLSSFLTNKEDRNSLKDFTPVYNKLKESRQELIKEVGSFFNTGHDSSRKIGVVIKRNSDFKTLFVKMNSLKKTIDSIDIKAIKDNLNKTIELMDLVVQRVQEKSIDSVTPEVAKNLSFGAYEVASEVEFFSVIYFKMIVLNTCIDFLTKKLSNFIKGVPE